MLGERRRGPAAQAPAGAVRPPVRLTATRLVAGRRREDAAAGWQRSAMMAPSMGHAALARIVPGRPGAAGLAVRSDARAAAAGDGISTVHDALKAPIRPQTTGNPMDTAPWWSRCVSTPEQHRGTPCRPYVGGHAVCRRSHRPSLRCCGCPTHRFRAPTARAVDASAGLSSRHALGCTPLACGRDARGRDCRSRWPWVARTAAPSGRRAARPSVARASRWPSLAPSRSSMSVPSRIPPVIKKPAADAAASGHNIRGMPRGARRGV